MLPTDMPRPDSMLRIASGRLDDPRVVALLQVHLRTARAQTAPGSAHALDLSGLKAPGIRFWTVWEDETLLGTGALKMLSADHGEVKSMHTAQAARRRGAGSAMLRHIIDSARGEGLQRLSLERALGISSGRRMRSTDRMGSWSAGRLRTT
jgi:putative acetyltransferase